MTAWPALPLGVAGLILEDRDLSPLLTPEAEIRSMLAFEGALARAQHRFGEITSEALHAIEAACRKTAIDHAELADGLRRDGVIVPALVRAIRASIGEPHAASFHRGTTSQDVVDSALMLRLKSAVAILQRRLADIEASLEDFASMYGAHEVMARTRFQDALPFTLGSRIETWVAPLRDLARDAPTSFPLQLGGPIGERDAAFGPEGSEIEKAMAEDLGLGVASRSWHTDRRPIGNVVHWCIGIATALGKLGQDVALMTQTQVAELRGSGGGSSAMAHKNNPIGAERLVTLARYVAGHGAMMQSAALHENERSGIAWTLEWLALPPLLLGCGAATLGANDLLNSLSPGEAAART